MAGATTSTSGYFAVDVKKDCPHIATALHEDITVDIQAPCGRCANVGENWLCLTCSIVFCSRYVKEHMVEHNMETQHPIALSFSDASVWCYSCESYIDSPVLRQICNSVSVAKS
ncbi:NAD-dependent deacetylase sir2A-like [Hydractinia symbiolongicarpus]|uniref:NAD-dependent deacetylase sir2A-like n=1 Tax=Hydractinia symbiolongicarpus TaxID=13093 RepID=UPI00254E03A9|nr:NAD-dependent deacetylase sir2A-like [Hydractinia symbiolongicarpus]